jgi:hypothetical protein
MYPAVASPVRANDWVVKSAHRPSRSDRLKGAYGRWAKREGGVVVEPPPPPPPPPPSSTAEEMPVVIVDVDFDDDDRGGGGPHEDGFGTYGTLNVDMVE